MTTRRVLYFGKAIGVTVILAGLLVGMSARQPAGQPVAIGGDDLGWESRWVAR